MPPNEEEPPITGMCIVSNPEQCPHEYEVVRVTQPSMTS